MSLSTFTPYTLSFSLYYSSQEPLTTALPYPASPNHGSYNYAPETQSPTKKRKRRPKKMNISIPETQSPDRNPRRLQLFQPKTYSTGDSSCGNGLSRLRRTCGLAKNYPADQPVPEPEPVSDSSDTVDVPNAQPEKYGPEAMPDMDIDNDEHEMTTTPSENVTEPILPPNTSSSNEEAEDMYVDYRV